MFESIIELVPEDKREAVRAELSSAVVIKSREDADRYLSEHPHLKSARDAVISKTTENYAKKFKEDDLPKLLEEERKKGQKQPWEIEIEKLKAENAEKDRQAILKDRRAEAQKLFAESGLPIDLADFALDTDETAYKAKIEKLTGLKAWGDSLVSKALSERLGNQPAPKGGSSGGKTMSRAEFDRLSPSEKATVGRSGTVITD